MEQEERLSRRYVETVRADARVEAAALMGSLDEDGDAPLVLHLPTDVLGRVGMLADETGETIDGLTTRALRELVARELGAGWTGS